MEDEKEAYAIQELQEELGAEELTLSYHLMHTHIWSNIMAPIYNDRLLQGPNDKPSSVRSTDERPKASRIIFLQHS